ncbi:hypothetical protein V8G54_003713 [Vigna mungo]|uniref:Superoxide dismutase copper/zinc binding domain-containing protein n=1 Tax=Vigna mungo TaxID=3915 RepID=A0AAQ3PD50_VIGMU
MNGNFCQRGLVKQGGNMDGKDFGWDFLISAAVSEFKGPDIFGVVRLAQVNMELARIEGNFSGLSPGKHGWSINEFGDLTRGAASTGKIFNPINEENSKEKVGPQTSLGGHRLIGMCRVDKKKPYATHSGNFKASSYYPGLTRLSRVESDASSSTICSMRSKRNTKHVDKFQGGNLKVRKWYIKKRIVVAFACNSD